MNHPPGEAARMAGVTPVERPAARARAAYVRSANKDPKAPAVIREAAMRLFAERGTAAVTVREVTAATGVSPGLVMHQYGSKAGLKDAADRRVVAFFQEMIGELARTGGRAAARRSRSCSPPGWNASR